MRATIVIDTSREIPLDLYEQYQIYPVGYLLKDSKNNIHRERKTVRELATSELLEIAKKDKKAELLAPSIKDFVELYTYLSEDYDTIISLHSATITPAVFENAILAKKLVSEAKIDVVDTPTFGPSSAIMVEEMIKAIEKAKSINDVRKEGFNVSRNLQSLLLSKNDQLSKVGLRKSSWLSGLSATFRPYVLYRLFHNNWKEEKRSRNEKSLFKEIRNIIQIVKEAKDISKVYYNSFILEDEFKNILEDCFNDKVKVEQSHASLVSHFLLGGKYSSIAIL